MSHLRESRHLKIPFEEIKTATNDFEKCIGKGGYGQVYKGELPICGKPTIVAVKRLNEQFGQGLKEFLTEIQLLSGQDHPNLISLLGYSDEGLEKIIVYEYAERGSLDQYLRRTDTTYTLTWSERLKICVDAARGLDYLHNHVGEHQTIIHRDIKSSNILIDQNWVAKISDLGLSKLSLAGLNRSDVVSHACGTQGYCEQEYINTGIVTKESDVYSFGMVLFEVLCGRLCTVRDDDGLLLSGPLIKDYYKSKRLDEIVDPSLSEQMSSNSMNIFLAIAYECLHKDRAQRPTIDLVVQELEESLEIQRTASCVYLDVGNLAISWTDVDLKERIGRGSIHRAKWNGRDVVVKILFKQDSHPERLKEFLQEVRTMNRLRHPNIVRVLGVVTQPMSIVLQEVPRGSLLRNLNEPHQSELLEKRHWSSVALDVAKGMDYLHSRHPPIVHGYLKSENVLVDEEFTLKVSDFGLSRFKAKTFVAGSVEWMAPEVLLGEPLDEKSDVYSFGVILWELSTRRYPWRDINPEKVVKAVGYEGKRLEIPRSVDRRVAALMEACWANDPLERPSFSSIMDSLRPFILPRASLQRRHRQSK